MNDCIATVMITAPHITGRPETSTTNKSDQEIASPIFEAVAKSGPISLCTENHRTLLQHTMTWESANDPYDEMNHPDFEMNLLIVNHRIGQRVYICKNSINNRILEIPRLLGNITAKAYRMGESHLTPPISSLFREEYYGHDRARY